LILPLSPSGLSPQGKEKGKEFLIFGIYKIKSWEFCKSCKNLGSRQKKRKLSKFQKLGKFFCGCFFDKCFVPLQ